jgi:hypothetical protein
MKELSFTKKKTQKKKLEIYECMEFSNKLKPITYIKCSAYLLTLKKKKKLEYALP